MVSKTQTSPRVRAVNAWTKNAYFWILGAFLISRIAYYWAGVRFDRSIVEGNFQYIDVPLLKSKLLESLFYCHTQPPLLNLLAGAAVKLFGDHYAAALHVVYLAVGLSSGILLYRLMRHLRVGEKLAALLTILFLVSPGCILFENYPMYEYLAMWLVLLSCMALYALLKEPTLGKSFTFFAIFAALAWLRALYHPVLFVFFAGVLWFLLPRRRRLVVAGCAAPLLLVLALFVKNYLVFGMFAGSSWLGFALDSCTIHQLTPDEKESLIAGGKLLPMARVEGPSIVQAYRPFFPDLKPTGISALDQEFKSSGFINANHLVYLKAESVYRVMAGQVLRNYPIAYVRSVMIAWFCYFLPPSDFFQFEHNRAAIRPLERAVNVLVYGQFRETTRKGLRELKASGHTASLPLYTGTFLIIGFPALFFWGCWWVWRAWRKSGLGSNERVLVSFILFHILWLILTTNFLSSFENNRYRYPTEPLYVALAAMAIQRAVQGRTATTQEPGGLLNGFGDSINLDSEHTHHNPPRPS
ncbi:MAG: hypothetical protein IT167_18270 [Bryobacterales bacterium]|nr:hypothetical protein [Bryobacterales bacterium]